MTSSDHDYVLAILTTGRRANELATAEASVLGAGHRARIEAMAAAGTLLLAGPFGESVHENWRGIFVFDVADVGEAAALTRTDPSIDAGLFDAKLMRWRSNVDLAPVRARLEAAKAAGRPFVPAAYVLGIGKPAGDVRRALPRLMESQRVIGGGELGEERDGEFLLLLRVAALEDARELLQQSDSRVSWELSSFWATNLLGQLADAPGEDDSGSSTTER